MNDAVGTVFGPGSVVRTARVKDGVVELRLNGWTLANGKHPSLFAPESTLGAAYEGSSMVDVGTTKFETPPSGTTKLGGEEVVLLNDEHFSKIRKAMRVPTEILATRGQWKFEDLKASGGKGGDMMGRSSGSTFGKYFVKEVSGSDHSTLLKIAGEYADHVTSQGGSFICRFFMHVKHVNSGRFYVVMNNWIPSVEAATEGRMTKLERPHDVYQFLYDLKGAADDKTQRRDSAAVPEVHMRCWHCRDICREYVCGTSVCGAGTEKRKMYRDGKTHAFSRKFHVAADQRDTILRRIGKDVEFLTKLGLMDYSLIVGVKIAKSGTDADELKAQGGFLPGDSPDQPFSVIDDGSGDVTGYYIGVIDFLQEWTFKKTVANCIKTIACAPKPLATVPPKVYGERFVTYFKNKFVVSGSLFICEDMPSSEGPSQGAVTGASKGEEDDFVEISLA